MVVKINLLAYVRVSTEQQKKDGTHKTQEKAIKDWAKANNHKIIAWYRDLATSGKDVTSRPRFQQMLDDIKTKGDGIIALRLSRTARSTKDLLMFVDEVVDKLNKDLFYVKDPIDTTSPYGRFFLTLLGAIAELEREIIRENTELGRARARAEGKKLGGPKEVRLSKKKVLYELKRGNSPERIGKLLEPRVSGKTIRRRMQEWGIYEDYLHGEFRLR